MYSGSKFYRSSKLMDLSNVFCLSVNSDKLCCCDSSSSNRSCSAESSMVFPSLSTNFNIRYKLYSGSSSSGIGTVSPRSAVMLRRLRRDEVFDTFDNLDLTEALSRFLFPSCAFSASRPLRPLPVVSFILP